MNKIRNKSKYVEAQAASDKTERRQEKNTTKKKLKMTTTKKRLAICPAIRKTTVV